MTLRMDAFPWVNNGRVQEDLGRMIGSRDWREAFRKREATIVHHSQWTQTTKDKWLGYLDEARDMIQAVLDSGKAFEENGALRLNFEFVKKQRQQLQQQQQHQAKRPAPQDSTVSDPKRPKTSSDAPSSQQSQALLVLDTSTSASTSLGPNMSSSSKAMSAPSTSVAPDGQNVRPTLAAPTNGQLGPMPSSSSSPTSRPALAPIVAPLPLVPIATNSSFGQLVGLHAETLARLGQATSSNACWMQHCDNLVVEGRKLEEKYSKLKDKYFQLKESMGSEQVRADKLESRAARLRVHVDTLESKATRLKAQVNTLESDSDHLRSAIATKDTTIKFLESSLKHANDRVDKEQAKRREEEGKRHDAGRKRIEAEAATMRWQGEARLAQNETMNLRQDLMLARRSLNCERVLRTASEEAIKQMKLDWEHVDLNSPEARQRLAQVQKHASEQSQRALEAVRHLQDKTAQSAKDAALVTQLQSREKTLQDNISQLRDEVKQLKMLNGVLQSTVDAVVKPGV